MASCMTIYLQGDLLFADVNYKKKPFFADIIKSEANCIDVSMEKVGKTDSAGLSLMIEGVRLAKKHHKQLKYVGVSEQLLSLAKFCRVDNLLLGNDGKT